VIPRRTFALVAWLTLPLTISAAGDAREPQAISKSPAPASSRATTSRGSRARFTQYQIAAGTTLPIELRTPLSSNLNRTADAMAGRLLRPLTTPDGVELVPAGASVLGTVSEAHPAGPKQRGRLAFSFQVIEHPETGSRAMIKTSELMFESDIPAKGTLFTEVRLDKGRDASVLLLAPLLVSIPLR
jgi:hypothetical protein